MKFYRSGWYEPLDVYLKNPRLTDPAFHMDGINIAPQQYPYADGPGYKPRPDEAGDGDAFSRALAAHGSLLRLLARWLPDQADVERVLWRNPARLFGFTESH